MGLIDLGIVPLSSHPGEGSSCSSPSEGADTAYPALPILPGFTCSLQILNPSGLEKRELHLQCNFICTVLGVQSKCTLLGGCVSPGTSLCSHGESPAWSVCEEEEPVQPPNPSLVSPWSLRAPVWSRTGSCPTQWSCPGERLF